jgi:rhodanese-related sulfurtransferase
MSKTITVQDLARRIRSGEPIQLIDVRSAGEYAAGHVPQASNIPLEQLESRLDDLGHQPVAVLCQSGNRAGMACEVLAGHRDDVLLVEGGTSAWQAAGLPVISTTTSKWALERQVRLIAGLLVLAGTILSVLVAPAWIYLAMFVGAGLTFAGLTNVCGMAFILARLPWNRPATPTGRRVEARS